MENRKIDLLKNTLSFWDKISENQREALVENSNFIRYKRGQCIYSAGNECLGVILVKSGELRAFMLSDEGREFTLYRLNSGSVCIMSASCLLKNITFDVFINAECDSEVLLINANVFESLQRQNLYVENFALKVAVSKFSDVMWTMEQLLFYKFEKRLALFLIDECNKLNSTTISLTHEQIAKYIGSAREVVSRTLKRFEKKEIVKLSSGQIEILSTEKLNGLND